MKYMLAMGLALGAAACGSDVATSGGSGEPGLREDGTVDPALCEGGAYDEEGNLVVTGDPCYDAWAVSIAGFIGSIEAQTARYRDACGGVALALGQADTWSSEPTVLAQAETACAAVDQSMSPEGVTCTLADTQGCMVDVTCESEVSPAPVDLAAYESSIVAAFEVCCSSSATIVDPTVFLPPTECVPAPGTEACFLDLFDPTALQSFGSLLSSTCNITTELEGSQAP